MQREVVQANDGRGASEQRLSRRSVLRVALGAGAGWAGATLLGACSGGTAAPAAKPAAVPTTGSATASPGSSGGQEAAQVDKVRMACWSNPISEQTNVFAAQEFGWFPAQGVDFEFLPGAGGGDALKNLLAGNADIAFANTEAMLFAMEQGSKLRGVWNIYPDNVFNLVSLTSSGIATPADLKGKRVGVYSQASGTRYNLLVMLRSANLRESDVEVVAVGVANFAPLMEGKIDAMAATDTGLWAAEAAGLGPHQVMWARDFLPTPTDIFVVADEASASHKESIRRFLRAYRQGSQWMLDHPEEASTLAVKYASDGQDPQKNLEIIKIRNASTVNEGTRQNGLGWFDLNVLRQVESAFAELGITKTRVAFADAFTNEFVEKA